LNGCGCKVAMDDGPPPPIMESLPDGRYYPGEKGV